MLNEEKCIETIFDTECKMSTPEQLILEKIRKFEEYTKDARWDELVDTCYAASASMSHFAAPGPIQGSKSIKEFFEANPSGYKLNLQFTSVELNPDAFLIAGIGSVNDGAWCPFVERWELIDGDWLIVEDKVCAPELWME